MMEMMRSAILLILLLRDADAFPITSSNSSRKDRARPKTGGGVGFGKNKQPILIHDVCDDPKILKLLDFLVDEQDAKIDNGVQVGVSRETGMRGVFSTRPFNKGEILFQIPSNTALALSDPSSDEETSLVQAGLNFLEMYLWHPERQISWGPYLETLPKLETGYSLLGETPDFFEDQELELLEFPRIINQARKRRQELQDIVLAHSPSVTLEQIQWASWIVSSRAIALSMGSHQDSSSPPSQPRVDDMGRPILRKEDKVLRVLVPFLDLVNHSSNAPNTGLHLIDPDKDNAWFALKATRDISAGKEILYSYGNGVESSVELLTNYGFVPRDNKMDVLMLKKGGEDTLTSVGQWSTTVEEDETMLEEIKNVGQSGNNSRLRTILEFRARMKKSIGEF